MAVVVSDEVTFNAAYTYLDTKYTNFIFSALSGNDIVRAGNCTAATQNAADGTPIPVCEVSLNGNQLERAPRHGLTFGLNGSFPVTDDFNIVAELATQYQGQAVPSPLEPVDAAVLLECGRSFRCRRGFLVGHFLCGQSIGLRKPFAAAKRCSTCSPSARPLTYSCLMNGRLGCD